MSLTHRLVRMSGRDPAERHRAPTPLELLFDLTFVVSFSVMSSETAHVLEAGHWAPGIAAFVLSCSPCTCCSCGRRTASISGPSPRPRR